MLGGSGLVYILITYHFPVQVEEFRDVVDKEYYGWVSQYLVMKRVSIEPNFHVLYMNFLDALNGKQMFTSVLKETHRNIKVCIHVTNLCKWVIVGGVFNTSDLQRFFKNISSVGQVRVFKNIELKVEYNC